MSDPNWENLKEIFHAAVALKPDERAAYLAQACDGNAALRRSVESLINSHEESNFIDSPAYQAAAQMLVDSTSVETGRKVNHYEILSILGKGGMGEVYLAQDTKLGRKVALKFLPGYLTQDRERLRRFEQEARAASALNHPNILTIHEIGEAEGQRFIVTEFIDGQTLRERLEGGPLSIGDALKVAAEIASALAAANAEGIIHRDIKPENVMLRRDGIVKVLDFGLAKVSAVTQPEKNADSSLVKTSSGIVMGTVTYMSPEQARGLPLDARTDIWSLGLILYETLDGHNPFEGPSKSDVIASILHREPPTLKIGSRQTGEALERIAKRALHKDRDQRYQTVIEMLSDLNELKQRLQFELEMKRTQSQESVFTQTDTDSSFNGVETNSSHERLTHVSFIRTVKVHPLAAGLVLATILIFATGFGFGLYRLNRENRLASTRPVPFEKIRLTSLTNTGRITDSAISPDGKYVAYVENDVGRDGIFLRPIASPGKIQIVTPANTEYYGLTFSNNGDSVYYIAKERNNSIGTLYQVPFLGGPPTKVLVDVDGPVSFSPDGQEFAFVRGSSTGERALMVARTDGTGERIIASRHGPESFSYGGPAWSPDGANVACGAGNADAGSRYMTVVSVAIRDGTVRPLSSQKWGSVGRVGWLQDGSGVIFTATEQTGKSASQLWYLSYPGGQARRVTTDLDDYNGVSLTSNAAELATAQTQTLSNIWVMPNGATARAKRISSIKFDGQYGFYNRFVWMPDDRLIYTSIAKTNPGIFVMNADGTGSQQLMAGQGNNTFPSVSPDGRFIVFVSDRNGPSQIWISDVEGKNEKRLTNGTDDSWPQFSADGQWVVYQSIVEGRRTLWKVPVAGGDPFPLTDHPSVCPVVSPDGKWISCYYRAETKAPWKLAIIPIAGGDPVKLFDIPPTVTLLSLVRWTPDGRALAYIDNREGVSNIWALPLDGSKPSQLTDFTTERIFWFDWSRDGKQLALTRGSVSSDVVLINAAP